MKPPRVAVLALTAAIAACSTGFESPSLVIDLRPLGMRADPAEIVVDFDPAAPADVAIPPVTITSLVADPPVDRPLRWRLRACAPTESARCDDPGGLVRDVGEGVIDDPERTGARPVGVLQADLALLQDAVRTDDVLGFGGVRVQVELQIGAEGEAPIFASKGVVYAPRQPPERVANENPTIAALLVDGEPWIGSRCGDGEPRRVAPGTALVLEPAEPAGVRETYVLPAFDGTTRTLTENLRYSWFATAGRWSRERTGGERDLFGNLPPLDSTWTAPADVPAATEVRMWLVQRDDRGGASFHERCVVVE